MQNWEYLTQTRICPNKDPYWEEGMKTESVATRLKRVGENGWESVTAYPVSIDPSSSWAGRTSYVLFVFKRPINK
jgi:hypothetical protein